MATHSYPPQNRGLAQPFLRSAVKMGLTNNQTYEQLQAAGLAYGTRAFQSDMAALRSGPTPRAVPFGSVSNRVSFSPTTSKILSKGESRYQYIFEARIRNSAGQYTNQTATWSFTSPSLLIPDIAAGIGIALAPDFTTETYSSQVPPDTLPINPSDVYMYDNPYQLGNTNLVE